MHIIKIDKPLIEVSWLNDHLTADNLVILNATLPKAIAGDKTIKEQIHRIPGARFFDIKNIFSNISAPYPNTWPGKEGFNQAAKDLGIQNNSAIVVYDEHGIYSSARAYWMFKAMGHDQVAVLDGGLIAWKDAGYSLEEKTENTFKKGNFEGMYKKGHFKDSQDVLALLGSESDLVVDARAADRFEGLVEEPRKGLRSGHIPGSINVPYTDLLKNGKLLELAKIQNVMKDKLSEDKNITFSCGSGITACVLALGAELAGYKDISVYDGSWTEWGSMHELPIEKGEQV